MDAAVLKYIIVPLVAVIGIYIVGSTIYELFGIPAVALFSAVGGAAFIAKFYKN